MQSSVIVQKNTNIILLVLVAAAIFALAFSDILLAVISQWTGEESAGNSHGPLVLVCTLYLLVLKRDQFKKLSVTPQPIGFLLLALLLVVFFLAELTEINSLQMLIVPLLVLSSIFTLLGKEYLKVALVPIAIMFFALPIWAPLVPFLQDITTWVTEFNLNVLGRPVYVVGNYLHVAGGVFLIEEGCSGLRFLLIASILSLINSDLNSHTVKQGIAMLALAVGLAMLANWVRVIVIVVLGDMTNMQHSLVHDHANFGWVVFLFVVLIPFLLVSRMISRNDIEPSQETKQEAKQETKQGTRTAPGIKYFIVAMLMLTSVPFLRYGLELISEDFDGEIELPAAFANWNGNDTVLNNRSWKPGYKNASKEIFKSYSGDSGVDVDLFLFHYAKQEQGAELINVENDIADGSLWNVVPSTEGEYLISGGQNITRVNEAEITNNSNERKLVWYWYDIGGYITSNQYYAKLFQVFAQLRGKNYANLIAVSTTCKTECKERQQYLEQYLLDWQRVEN
jgi:EpsI family protein